VHPLPCFTRDLDGVPLDYSVICHYANGGLYINTMPKCQRLSEEGRNSRRTIADAIEVLHEQTGFGGADQANIRIGLLTSPSAQIVGLVNIFFDRPSPDEVYVVSLPTSMQFVARRPNSSQRDHFEIAELDGAVLDDAGKVLLINGMTLCAVEFIPARLPLEPSRLEWRIVHHAISLMEAENRCYRSLRDGVPPEVREMVPDLRFLDCSTLTDLPIPPLKVIASLIQERAPNHERPSQQKIADTLRKFGIRIPRPRPRVNGRRTFAVI
jgi:hypothetical protein